MQAVDLVRAAARHPIARFTAIGLALFVWTRTIGAPEPEPPFAPGTVVTDNELLARLAINSGIGEDDKEIRARLVQNMRTTEGERGRSEEELLSDAIALGMMKTDPAVRNRLARMMMNEFGREEWTKPRSREELEAYLAANPEQFTRRVSVSHVFFLTRERAEAADPEAPDLAADPSPAPHDLSDQMEREVAEVLGVEAARAAFELPIGEWSAPLPLVDGFMRMVVRSRTESPLPALEAVEARVSNALRSERTEAAIEKQIAKLRETYGLPAGEAK